MKILTGHAVIPVLVIEDASWARDLGEVLVQSGLPIVEVTLRTEQSWAAARAMREVSGLLLGLGSVTKSADLKAGKELGIDFAVSAGIRGDLVESAGELEIPYIPGVATPSEVLLGVELGLELLKWFPAEQFGGIKALKAISAPFPKMRFLPTGGISEKNASEYLAEDCVSAVGGSWMFPKAAMATKDLALIASAAKIAASFTKES